MNFIKEQNGELMMMKHLNQTQSPLQLTKVYGQKMRDKIGYGTQTQTKTNIGNVKLRRLDDIEKRNPQLKQALTTKNMTRNSRSMFATDKEPERVELSNEKKKSKNFLPPTI